MVRFKNELKREMVFRELSGETHIIDVWEPELGLPGIIEKLSARKVRSAVHENLFKLKQLLESGSVTLQDGRTYRIAD